MLKHNLNWDNLMRGLESPREAVDSTLFELFYRTPMTYLNTMTTVGTNVFSREWDLLILLDTCRVDALQEVADEYDFIEKIESIRSVGGRSPEWVANTFVEEYEETVRETAYLSANVFSRQILQERHHESVSKDDVNMAYSLLERIPTVDISSLGRFEYLYEYEPVGKEGPLGHVEGGTPPRYVTDRGVAIGREFDFDRMILHYLQPHPPYVANAVGSGRELKQHESDWWGYLRETGDYETIWNTYIDELRYVLDEVEILLENIDAESVVISADHGESFGEYWEFGHKTGSINPKVRTVPWVETTAEDTGSYTSSISPPSDSESNDDVNERLEALGYQM